jgi:cytochrome P450
MTSVTPSLPADSPPVGGRFRPLLGLRRSVLGHVEQMWRAHGDVVREVLGPPGLDREVVMVHHPDGAARVLSGSSRHAFVKRDRGNEEVGYWFGRGLLVAEGEEWTHQKRFIQPVFTKTAVEGYAGLMVDEVERVLADRDAEAEEVVDLSRWMPSLTLRVVLRALFGEADDDVLDHVRHAFPVVSEVVVRRTSGFVRLPPSLPTRRVRRGRVAQRELFALGDAVVAARRGAEVDGGTDLLSRLLAARDGEERLSDTEVRDQVLTFLIAGHETTATALTFALHLLGRHPGLQDDVRREARAAAGGGRLAAAALADLPLTGAVLREAMRLYPSVPIVPRLVAEEDEVLGHRLRAGSTVLVSPWTIHRHPDFWERPLEFDPARFAPGTEAGRHRYAWMPFGGGPRACIGQHFALVEAQLALAVILREHAVTSLVPTDRVPVDTLVTLHPTVPVLARVQRMRG